MDAAPTLMGIPTTPATEPAALTWTRWSSALAETPLIKCSEGVCVCFLSC